MSARRYKKRGSLWTPVNASDVPCFYFTRSKGVKHVANRWRRPCYKLSSLVSKLRRNSITSARSPPSLLKNGCTASGPGQGRAADWSPPEILAATPKRHYVDCGHLINKDKVAPGSPGPVSSSLAPFGSVGDYVIIIHHRRRRTSSL